MKSLLKVLLSLALFITSISVSMAKTQLEPEVNYRIPANIFPSHYNLSFKPYLHPGDGKNQFTFDAEVFINIETSKSNLTSIVLHSKNLTYKVRELYETAVPQTKLEITKFDVDSITDKFTLTLVAALKPQISYTLHFVYTGRIEDDMDGFYKSSYVDIKNNTRWLASTHFQPNSARRAFPSFDEPKFKATFDLAITRFKSFKTVSNTRLVQSQRIDKNYYRDVFATTPKMSTYLLAFLVSDFNERNDINGEFYVVARPEYFSQSEYSFEVGPKLLAQYDKYTKLPFYETGVDKMHLAAIPDFSAGAMENWGLLTYKFSARRDNISENMKLMYLYFDFRERVLLYEEGSTPISAKQIIAGAIAHEQAHMWFGNLVTCEWWSFIWLHEGFASYFQYFMTATVHPELEMDKQFVVDQMQNVFEKDSTNDTHPLSDITVASSRDISRIFGAISYFKGASVIRMIKHAIGEQKFHKSLQDYLNAFKYNNTVPKNIFDQWKANWPQYSRIYADGVLTSFTDQVGYPVIYIELANDSKSMTIEQKRFVLTPGDGTDSKLLYTIPFTYTTNLERDFNSTNPHVYLEPKTGKATINLKEPVKWVIGNIQETGYYRVNYSTSAWHQLHDALRSENWGGIHELNRAQYVDDLLALSRAGELDYELALMCLSYLDTETNYLPWNAAFNGFGFLENHLGFNKENFAYFIIKLSKKAYTTLGLEEKNTDKTLDIYARNKVISWNCKYGHGDCITESLNFFRNMHNTPVPINIREAVYCTAMRDGTEADFEKLYQKLKTEEVPTELASILKNLGCVRDKKLVERLFNIILSDDIRRQDKSRTLKTLYTENAENVSPIFDLVTEKLDTFKEAMGSYSAVATEISNIASRFTTKEQQDKLAAFILANGSQFGSSQKTLIKAANKVKTNLAWSEKRLPSVLKYLKDFRNCARNIDISSLTIALVAFISYMLG